VTDPRLTALERLRRGNHRFSLPSPAATSTDAGAGCRQETGEAERAATGRAHDVRRGSAGEQTERRGVASGRDARERVNLERAVRFRA